MNFRRLFILALLCVAALPVASALAQFAAPPTDSYTLNILLEDSKGKVLYKEARKCDPMQWCDGPRYKDVTVNGDARDFFLKTKWEFNMLMFQRIFKQKSYHFAGLDDGQFPFRKDSKLEIVFYDTPDGAAPAGSAAVKKGPIAKLTMTIGY